MAEKKENKEKKEPKIKVGNVKKVMDGTILTNEKALEQMPFVFFLTILAVLYIANGYHAQRVYREILKTQSDVSDLRAESITVTSRLMYISKQSEVVKLVQQRGLGLIEAVEPPKKLEPGYE